MSPEVAVLRWLVISPHLDDAALSCGATVRALSGAGRVDVVTVFAGIPTVIPEAAREFHTACGLGDDAVRIRVEEDRLALARLGAHGIRLNLLDGVYRLDRHGHPRFDRVDRVFTADPADEPDVLAAIEGALAPWVGDPEYVRVFLPLGVGNHIDHRLVRHAVEKLAAGGRDRCVYYEELPYARGWNPEGVGGPASGLTPVLNKVDAYHWQAKVEAVAAYSSQVRNMWHGPDEMAADLYAYAVTFGGPGPAERFWVEPGTALGLLLPR